MSVRELRDLGEARQFVQAGLWLQRVLAPTTATVRTILEWALEAAANGHPLPPVGLLADLGHAVFLADQRALPGESVGWPHGLARAYEDHFLGKIHTDPNLERAADALRRYQGRDRARGLAFLLNQIGERAGFFGVHLSPGVLKGLIDVSPQETLARGWEILSQGTALPLLTQLYENIIAATRRTAELLGTEDVFELEHGTALAELGQRVALRQVLQASQRLESSLPDHKIRPTAGRRQMPTRILDEDIYPVGGYSSVANRGTIESLLHSQLAYMERNERPDLFDIKFLRDELLYYSRDENQFLRRRRTLLFVLCPDLARTRFKDAELPWQRCVLWLALLVAIVRRLIHWLNTDALHFEFCFIDGGNSEILAHEHGLLAMILRESIANGTVRLGRYPTAASVTAFCQRHARRSLCHCLTLSVTEPDEPFAPADAEIARLWVDGPCPKLEGERFETDDPLESWQATLERVLRIWV